jgi:hypothetical protein
VDHAANVFQKDHVVMERIRTRGQRMRTGQKGFTGLGSILMVAGMVTLVAGAVPKLHGAHGYASGSVVGGGRTEYVTRLRAMEGTPYLEAPCSTYICAAKQHEKCSAQQMWESCGGALEVEQEVESFASVDVAQLLAGDVVNFRGVHVAVYVGDGTWMDSIPERGVGRMATPVNSVDPWYSGPVRILRWAEKK